MLGYSKVCLSLYLLLSVKGIIYAKHQIEEDINNMQKYSSVKTMVISQASGIWIEFVSATSFFITLIFLILQTTNFTKKFSNWNAIQAAFGFIMAIFYFTCGLDLLIKGNNFKSLVTKCLFPEKWQNLTFGISYVSFFGSIVYGLYGLLALRRMMKWCCYQSSKIPYENQVNE